MNLDIVYQIYLKIILQMDHYVMQVNNSDSKQDLNKAPSYTTIITAEKKLCCLFSSSQFSEARCLQNV